MKKRIFLLLAAGLLVSMAVYGGEDAVPEVKEWTRQGAFEDKNGSYLLITLSDTEGYEGWGVTFMQGDQMAGWIIGQEGDVLHGNLNGWDESEAPFVVTIAEEGEDGVTLTVEGGETYHFVPMDIPEATIFVSINTEGMGSIAYAEGGEAPDVDPEYPFQSAQVNLAEPAVHTIAAWPAAGSRFVKWTKNGEDFSDLPQVTLLLDESADYVAVFEDDPEYAGEGNVGIANPWRSLTEDEAKALCPESFSAPEGAEKAEWSILEAIADPSGTPGALIQLSFDLDGRHFTAREQVTADPEADQSGMYYEWTAQSEEPLSQWDGITCHVSRWEGESAYAELAAWYDDETGISYSLSTAADDLDGFDILAVIEAMR